MTCLSTKLGMVETLSRDVERSLKNGISPYYLDFLKEIGCNPLNMTGFDAREAQRRLLLSYEDNRFLRMAIQGTRSLEDSVELETKDRNYGWLFPRKKNKERNENLNELAKLVGWRGVRGSYTNGVFVPDNFVTGTACFTLGMIGMGKAMGIDVPYQFPLIVGPVFGLVFSSMNASSYNPVDQAKYIDYKIKELLK